LSLKLKIFRFKAKDFESCSWDSHWIRGIQQGGLMPARFYGIFMIVITAITAVMEYIDVIAIFVFEINLSNVQSVNSESLKVWKTGRLKTKGWRLFTHLLIR